MKWTFIVQQKLKVVFLLGSVMLLITITNLMERRNIKNMNKFFSSIYYDRLIPATDIFYLTENLYAKRLLMENFLYAEDSITADEMRKSLNNHNMTIDTLIEKFSKTYLVKNESESLQDFKYRVEHYNTIENTILNAFTESRSSAQSLYESEGKRDLLLTIQHLKDLTKIQSTVGHSLVLDSKGTISNSNILLTLQITISIVIGLLIQGLVMASKTINRRDEKFNLN